MEKSNKKNKKANSVWYIMKPVKGKIIVAMFISVLNVISNMATLILIALLLGKLIQNTNVFPWEYLLGIILCTILSYTFRLKSFDLSHRAAFKLEKILRNNLGNHLAKTSLGYIQQVGSGSLAKILEDDVKSLHVFVADSTPLYARCFTAPLLTIAVLFYLDWRLALAAILLVLVGFIIMAILMSDRDLQKEYNDAQEEVSESIIEFVQAMPVVRTFDTGQITFSRFKNAIDKFSAILKKWYDANSNIVRFSMAILNPLPTLFLLMWMGAYLFWNSSLDTTTWIAILLLGTGICESITPIMFLFHLIEKSKIAVKRIFDILEAPILPQPKVENIKQPADSSVIFEDVDFSYLEGSNKVLHNINFKINPNTITALVGPSGAGKSTVAKLIPRFWDVTSGRILIGGVDIRDMNNDLLMKQVAFVFQDSFLFSNSIKENIALGIPNISDEEVYTAAKAAQIHDFIMSLQDGYDTKAGERGLFLSGGQKQRINIARAILQDKPILVLDEATAYSDPENEAELVKALSILMKNKTVIMVAHRLSTIQNANQILVFEKGTLVEAGKHDDLLTHNQTYSRLWNSYQKAQDWVLHTINNEKK